MTLHPDECLVGPDDPYTCIRPDHDDHLARLGQKLPLEGELITTPPEPPRDHVIVTYSGYVFMWSDELDNWLEVDTEHGTAESWEDICRYNSRLTVYKPIKEI